ncbi:MAG TPA: hypothetical protein VFS00_19905, partial [Polyangiaceae bacterium]|nr:hypothetical protein [Polyangiaceae bacterium]
RWLFAIDTLPALYGPLFYLYTRALLRRDVRASRAWPHFVPFVVYTLAELPRLLSPGVAKLALATGGQAASASLWLEALDWGVELQGLAYLVACLGVVRSHRAALEQAFSNLEKRQVRWLGRLLGVLLVLWVGSMAARATGLPVLIYVHAALTIVISAIAYRNAVEPELFEVALAETRPDAPAALHPPAPSSAPPAPPPAPSSAAPARPLELLSVAPTRPPKPSLSLPATSPAPSSGSPGTSPAPSSALTATPPDPSSAVPATSPDPPPAPAARAPVRPPSFDPSASADVAPAARYQKARLKDEQALDIAERLRAFFERERPYLDPDFALATLAERLGESPHHLSQVLNER